MHRTHKIGISQHTNTSGGIHEHHGTTAQHVSIQVSVEEFATLLCTTVAGQLVAGVLDGELVIIRELLSTVDTTRGKDDDVLLAIHSDDP